MKNNLKSLLISLVLLLFCVVSAQAKKDFIIPEFLVANVEGGNSEIAYFIANRLFDGSEKFKSDYDKGMIWLRKAADMGYALAMEELGYELDVEATEKEALSWFLKAADLGVGEVLDKIAQYHYQGKAGLQANCKVAYEWYEKAEIKGVKMAFNNHAWNLATSSEKKCRNPERALKIISKLWAEYGQDDLIPWYVWDTKAAVLASVADFSTAISLQEWVIEEMLEDELDVKNYQLHLDSYRLRKPWIEINDK